MNAKQDKLENTLVDLMSDFIELTDTEKISILEAFPIKSIKKGTVILEQGKIAENSFLVIEGCIRQYSISDDGEENTSAFFTEFESAVNFNSMANQRPSKYYFECIEETTLAVLNSKKENTLYKNHPRFLEVCRTEMEKILGQEQEKLFEFVHSTPKERYLSLLKNRGDLINRVPHYQLASYLGIKPETFSRIRKRVALVE